MQSLNATLKHKSFDYWFRKNRYYHEQILKIYKFITSTDSKVLHIGCQNGTILQKLNPSLGIGLDFNEQEIILARQRYPEYKFFLDKLDLDDNTKFDYIIISPIIMEVDDIQVLLESLKSYCHDRTRVILDWYSALWEPVLWLSQILGQRRPTNLKNWLSRSDMQNLLMLAGFETITTSRHILMPKNIPAISWILNNIFAHLPIINRLCLSYFLVARPKFINNQEDLSVSIIIPCRNEKGNVEPAAKRCPTLGKFTEIIFIEGHSKDGTLQEIERVAALYPEKNIRFSVQDGVGKGSAVRKGFDLAKGDILIIQDGDLTAPPEELPKFYNCLIRSDGEFINGSRLVYGMESEAMRFLNLIANYFFGLLFSWTFGQKIKDTLCGTKVLCKKDYERIVKNRKYFGDFDPFGDFDLLFGAAKLNLKIVDMPIRYKNRTYGSTQIRRFYHGFLLLKMSLLAIKKLKIR